MAGPPKDFMGILKYYGLSEGQYDLWVAGHEASHAVMAIAVGGRISSVLLNEQMNAERFSRARMQQDMDGADVTAVLAVGSAGPAYDALYGPSQGIPQPLILAVGANDLCTFLSLLKGPGARSAQAGWTEGSPEMHGDHPQA